MALSLLNFALHCRPIVAQQKNIMTKHFYRACQNSFCYFIRKLILSFCSSWNITWDVYQALLNDLSRLNTYIFPQSEYFHSVTDSV